MPFILKKFPVTKGKKIQIALLQDLTLKPKISSRMLSKSRVFNSNKIPYKISQIIEEDYIYMAVFEGYSRGLKPLVTFKDFAIFDKPSGLMIHPISKDTKYSLLDEIRFHFGEKANQAHRIDAETSGLVLVGKNNKTTNALATMFEKKEYKKSYIAIVKGNLKKEIIIDKNLKKEGKAIGVRMTTCSKEEGKESITKIRPLRYNEKKDITLVEVNPITGRQHQIRIHLHSIGHTILGDPIYGVKDKVAEDYLNKTLKEEERLEESGSFRLWLQANYLEFIYQKINYKIYSKNKDIYKYFND
ncbi:RNA pseudouridine synthase [Halarcobacter mediterraneus]|uniref:RNA pseudouridylate synthase n=1 Tax=Halarcobacter mediterraneus TaxID=2023153 RepID=A0A4Q1AU52_9BACT|nr:RluA family pseudouridine synthase [Halarcobacter mediterraneus]RXK12737.1 RNA pseudouridine synthase [Halarcobacter mediterraneus]